MEKQSDSTIIQGRVLKVRNLGGILFIEVLSNAHKMSLIYKKDYADTEDFNKVKQIRKDDYCYFVVEPAGDELQIVKLCSHIPKIQDSCWIEEQIEVLRAYSYLLYLLRDYSLQNGYIEVRLPSIHYGQNKGEVFSLDFFQHPARLTTSNALFLNTYAIQLSKVFSLQKCFRAESSHTNRHLAEFDLFEVAIMNTDLMSCMSEIEQLIKFIVDEFSKSDFEHLVRVDKNLVLNSSFPIIEYKQLDERYQLANKGLGKYDREITVNLPTFVVHFPQGIASWMAKPLDNRYALSFNLLVPMIGELAEGNEKQTNFELLSKKFKMANVETQLGWYTQMMPYSDFPLAGFGIGVERLLMWIMGLKNIRQINPIYRDTQFSEISNWKTGEQG